VQGNPGWGHMVEELPGTKFKAGSRIQRSRVLDTWSGGMDTWSRGMDRRSKVLDTRSGGQKGRWIGCLERV
jgi:hypothetical protein